MADETGEVQETEQDEQTSTDAEDPRVQKANREAAGYRRELRATQAELKKLRESTQTEQERVIAEAEQRGAATAAAKAGPRLVRAEFRAAAAAGRVDKETLDAYLEDVDLAKFLDQDGEPDVKAIESRITKLGGAARGTDFDGGARRTAERPADMNALIRQQAGLG
ncbi:hypothetical protein ACIBCR_16425 [Micromonospora echinospora]|uniref:hypothetical protein n=1 Tax=Micromonospora echinospora TaxID=1877 RepID=UPI0037AC92CF